MSDRSDSGNGGSPFRVTELVGRSDFMLGVTGWIRIGQARIDAFAEATEDRQWIHVDSERAARGPFGAPIAHGFLVVSLMPRLLMDVLTVPTGTALINYGLDRLRFVQPVLAGSRVRARLRLMQTSERESGTLLRLKARIVVAPEDALVAVAEPLLLVVPMPT